MEKNKKNKNIKRRKARGQALVEVAWMVILLFFFMIGSFEGSLLFRNYVVLSNALKQAAWQAARGAPDDIVLDTIINAGGTMMISGFLDHAVENFAVEVWNSETERIIAPTDMSDEYTPFAENRAPYITRASGYNIRVGMRYKVAFILPTMDHVQMVGNMVTASQPIVAANDEDHDGLVDLYEWEYFGAELGEDWTPYSHQDNGLQDLRTVDSDGDGVLNNAEGDWYKTAKYYDHNNDGIEDKFDFNDTGAFLRNPWRAQAMSY